MIDAADYLNGKVDFRAPRYWLAALDVPIASDIGFLTMKTVKHNVLELDVVLLIHVHLESAQPHATSAIHMLQAQYLACRRAAGTNLAIHHADLDVCVCVCVACVQGEHERAAMLYMKGGKLSKAVEMCFQGQLFDVLQHIADDLTASNNDPSLFMR